MRNTTTEVTPQSKGKRFPGITHAATELNVSRGHLYFVISGQRESKPLLKKWKQWLKDNPAYAAIQTQTF